MAILLGSFIGVFLILHLLFPLQIDVDYAPVVLARDGTPLYTWITRDQQWRMQAQLREITPELKKAIVYKEDKRFYYHPGIDLLSVTRAAGSNIFHLKRTSGASTITMQVARMLDRQPRSYWRKLVEMFRALQLELRYSKDEILQLYLNLVPYGSNIQGVKAASLLYFNKSPDQLSLAEITALSIIPNRPNSLVMGKDNARIVAARNKWLQRFRKAGLFPVATVDDALQEPLEAYRHDPPRMAPQLAWRLRWTYPGMQVIHSTIDAGKQLKAEGLVTNYVRALQLQNIYNAAVIVIDNRTHEVLTYIGSPDFMDRAHQGQVDGVRAPRSPGSTLKPLLYGLAFDKGLLTPKTVVADVPVNFAGYAPENYDLDFRGNVSIETALRQSLNIPAVKTLNALGAANMITGMKQAGMSTLQEKKNKPGLSLILGGCEVRLDELSNVYSAFANGGAYHSLRWLDSSSAGKTRTGKQVLSPAAAYMLTGILSELSRPDLPNMAANAVGVPHIAWKTGTSYGRKDAWSIGYDRNYTVGVWIGNFNGMGAPGLNGAGTATPLLFQLFNALGPAPAAAPNAPASLASRLVCAKTGKLPNDFCTDQQMDVYLPGISNNDRCDHLKMVYLSADEQFSYCTSCLPANGYKMKQYENTAPDLAAFYEQRHVSYQRIPPHNPSCTRVFSGAAPAITSLQDGMTYLVVDKDQQLTLSCTNGPDVQQVYWYVNDHYVGSALAGAKLFFVPADNKVKVSCTDDKGRTTTIRITVKFV
jgi:penicillin-binding protein 1C